MKRPLATSRKVIWIAGAAILILCVVHATVASVLNLQPERAGRGLAYHVAGVTIAAAIYLLAVWQKKRASVAVAGVLVLGLLMRLTLLAAPPVLEDDFYRYLWDGSVVARGLNPYRYSPQEALAAASGESGADLSLAAAAIKPREVLPNVNNPHLTTIYPPVAQAGFAVAHFLTPYSVTMLRLVFLGFDLATFGLLLALLCRLHLDPGWTLIYWWNPVVLKWTYAGAHMDVMVFPFVLLAIYAALSLRPMLSGASLALAAGVKLWPVVLLPVLAWHWRGSLRRVFAGAITCTALTFLVLSPMFLTSSTALGGLWTYAESWQNNAGLYALLEGTLSLWLSDVDARVLARLVTVALLVTWILLVASRGSQTPRALTRSALLVVAAVFLLSPAQFPWYYGWIVPLLVFWPAPALLAYTLFLPLFHLTPQHPWLIWLQHGPFWLILGWEAHRAWSQTLPPQAVTHEQTAPLDITTARVAVVIPALNEELSIGRVVGAIPKWVSQIVVVDNGSTDATAEVAMAAGAQVVCERRRGYGAACLAGIAALDRPDIVVFLDADFSDDPSEMTRLVAPICSGKADFVIGSRTLGTCEPGALSLQQRFGNALACWLIRLFWRQPYTDLGPFRAIHFEALQRLEMDDKTYGWTIQMQLRAARLALRVMEVPVSYRRRIGESKISGTLRGVVGAGTRILSLIVREKFWRPKKPLRSRERVIVFARYPVPGKTKTRLIERLGENGAADLQDAMTRHTLARVARVVATRAVEAEIRFTGAEKERMASQYGREWICTHQGEGDLGERLSRAVQDAFEAGVSRLVLIGTDCPALTSDGLTSAFDALEEFDLVVGPAMDGGYYLLGLRQPCLQLFKGIDWGTNAALDQTLEAAKKLRLSIRFLALLRDVDRPEDLPAWEVENGQSKSTFGMVESQGR